MAIKLEVKEYCSSCLDFEPDVTKPERVTKGTSGEYVVVQSDTIVKCRYARRCEAIKNYLNRQSEEAKE